MFMRREELKKKCASIIQNKAVDFVKGTVGKSKPWGMHEPERPEAVLEMLREEDTVAIYKE